MRKAYAPFGPLTDAQWRKLAEDAALANDDGSFSQAYDPAIAEPIRATPLADVDLWPVWDRVSAEVLLLRGAESDLLKADTASQMQERGPRTTLVEFAGVGHAPALLDPDQIAPVLAFLDA
jgi:pimeloyl-ACP methyl ester carboxylesterase